MKTKDPYLSELDALGDFPQPEEPTDAQLEGTPLPEETAPEPPAEPRTDSAAVASDVPVEIVVVLGRRGLTVKDVMELKSGQVVELNRLPNEAVDLVVGGKVFAKGELVEIEGKLGVRVLKLLK